MMTSQPGANKYYIEAFASIGSPPGNRQHIKDFTIPIARQGPCDSRKSIIGWPEFDAIRAEDS